MLLRVQTLIRHTLWADEHWQLRQMGGSFLNLLRSLPREEFCPYLSGDYYLVYPFFRLFSYNKYGLAIPHVIATAIGFYFFYRLCRQAYQSWGAYLVAFALLCFNATLILHATEIRTYAVLPTLALATFIFIPLFFDPREGLAEWKRWAAGFFLSAVVLFHLYGVMIVFFPLAYHLWIRVLDGGDVKKPVARVMKYASVGLLIVIPVWMYSVFGPHYTYPDYCSVFQYIPDPRTTPLGFLKGVFGNLVGNRVLYVLLPGLAIPFVIPENPDRMRQIAFLTLCILAPIGVILFIDVETKYWFIQRQFIWVMPFFAFYLGWSWDKAFLFVEQKLRKRIAQHLYFVLVTAAYVAQRMHVFRSR